MRKIILLLLAAGLLFGALYYFKPARKIVNYPSAGTDIIAFGDSLVAGVGSERGGFVSLLAEGIGRPIVNLGVSGDTTAKGLLRIDELDNYKPKVVLILLGGNDFLQKKDPEETFQNLDAIMAQVEKRGATVLLLGVRSGLLGSRYDSRYEELAKKRGAAYVPDVLDGIFGHGELMYDSIHPNDKGYKLIAEKVLPVLESLIR